MAKGSARRARVIKAMIAFVAILAVLTFFSNTIGTYFNKHFPYLKLEVMTM